GHQPAASVQTGGSIRQGQSPDTNAQLNARTNGNAQVNARTSNGRSANGQLERRSFTNESRMGASTRAGHAYAEPRTPRGERGAYAREERYGRGLRSERGLYARAGVEGGYRGGRVAYRERAIGTGVGVGAADYGYRGRRLYAYAPGYETGYATAPRYSYAAA